MNNLKQNLIKNKVLSKTRCTNLEFKFSRYYFQYVYQYSKEMKGLTTSCSPRIASLWKAITLTVPYFTLTCKFWPF